MIATLYLIGVIVSFIIMILVAKKSRQSITLGDLVLILIVTAYSWVGVIFGCIFFIDWDIVIWKREE